MIKDYKNIFTNVNLTLTKLCLLMLTAFAISIASFSGTVVKQQLMIKGYKNIFTNVTIFFTTAFADANSFCH